MGASYILSDQGFPAKDAAGNKVLGIFIVFG
jgi:hypothetical protein